MICPGKCQPERHRQLNAVLDYTVCEHFYQRLMLVQLCETRALGSGIIKTPLVGIKLFSTNRHHRHIYIPKSFRTSSLVG